MTAERKMITTESLVKQMFNDGISIATISSKLRLSQMTVCCILSS